MLHMLMLMLCVCEGGHRVVIVCRGLDPRWIASGGLPVPHFHRLSAGPLTPLSFLVTDLSCLLHVCDTSL